MHRYRTIAFTILLAAIGAVPAAAAGTSVLEQQVAIAQRELAALRPLATSASEPAYQRDAFGTAWADVDGNHCRTRDDILARDLTKVTRRGSCTVMSGVLADPYTGTTERFTKARASAVQIDHVVPLALAWRAGAWAWPAGKRATFANDPLNLLAVDGRLNMDKGDAGPSSWLPPNRAYRCTYVMRFVRVSFLYGVQVDAADRARARQVLRTCTRVVGRPMALTALSPTLWPHAATYVHVRA